MDMYNIMQKSPYNIILPLTSKVLSIIIDFFYPRICLICKELSKYKICLSCYREFRKLDKLQYCERCGALGRNLSNNSLCFHCEPLKRIPYHSINSIFMYTLGVKNLIHKFKFQNSQHLAKLISRFINHKYHNMIKEHDLIIPVPVRYTSLIKRGYHHTLEVVKLLSRSNNIEYKCLIKKCKNTKKQHHLKHNKRQENIYNAFSIKQKYKTLIENKNIILFDDIITTGATIQECCGVIQKFKPNKVTILSFARTLKYK